MDSIRSKQIDEVLNYDKNANAMVFNLEKKRTAMYPDPPKIPESQIDAQVMTTINNAVQSMRVLLDRKNASVSMMIHPGGDYNSQAFRQSVSEIGQVENVIQLFNQIITPFKSPSISDKTRRQTMIKLQEIIKPITQIMTGLYKAITGLVSEIERGLSTPSFSPTLVLCFVRSVEALGVYVAMSDQIRNGQFMIIGDNEVSPRIWDLINKHKSWKAIAGRKNVEKLFRDFDVEEWENDGKPSIPTPANIKPKTTTTGETQTDPPKTTSGETQTDPREPGDMQRPSGQMGTQTNNDGGVSSGTQTNQVVSNDTGAQTNRVVSSDTGAQTNNDRGVSSGTQTKGSGVGGTPVDADDQDEFYDAEETENYFIGDDDDDAETQLDNEAIWKAFYATQEKDRNKRKRVPEEDERGDVRASASSTGLTQDEDLPRETPTIRANAALPLARTLRSEPYGGLQLREVPGRGVLVQTPNGNLALTGKIMAAYIRSLARNKLDQFYKKI